jgi:hypothetical protein
VDRDSPESLFLFLGTPPDFVALPTLVGGIVYERSVDEEGGLFQPPFWLDSQLSGRCIFCVMM